MRILPEASSLQTDLGLRLDDQPVSDAFVASGVLPRHIADERLDTLGGPQAPRFSLDTMREVPLALLRSPAPGQYRVGSDDADDLAQQLAAHGQGRDNKASTFVVRKPQALGQPRSGHPVLDARVLVLQCQLLAQQPGQGGHHGQAKPTDRRGSAIVGQDGPPRTWCNVRSQRVSYGQHLTGVKHANAIRGLPSPPLMAPQAV